MPVHAPVFLPANNDQPTHGTILLDGIDTHGMNAIQVNKAGIARTFQNIRLFSTLSVEDNVKLGMHNHVNYNTLEGILRLRSLGNNLSIIQNRNAFANACHQTHVMFNQ